MPPVPSAHTELIDHLTRNGRAFAHGNNITDADQINAIEHAFTSAEMTFRRGRAVAEVWGFLKDPNWSSPDSYRDRWNNEVGRRMAEWALDHGYGPEVLDRLMWDAYHNGQLITSLSDERINTLGADPDPTWHTPTIWDPGNWGDPHDGLLPRNYDGIPGVSEFTEWLFDNLLDLFGIIINILDVALDLIEGLLSPLVDLLRDILGDPIVLDLDGDGIELVALAGSAVQFDMDDDGVAERTGWVSPHDGFLVHDANANGLADGIDELFGSANVDGYDELATLDSNHDGRIDASDPAFAELMVWRDLNGDGEATADEMLTLAQAGIAANDNDLLRKIAA